jgi:hypothetical protein
MQANLLGRVQPQVSDPKVEDFLEARAGIAHEGKEHVIPLTRWRAPIDVLQQ